MSGYPDLAVEMPDGRCWRWCGREIVLTRRGEAVRLERFSIACRACGEQFSQLAKLPAALR
jgi:hypothetical protein